MAIHAIDLDRVGDFGLDIAVAVGVAGEVTIDAVHAELQVERLHVHCLLEFIGIVVRHDVAVAIEQVALAVFLEDGAEVPTVAVIVGELGVLRFGIDVGPNLGQELHVTPFTACSCFFRVAHETLSRPIATATTTSRRRSGCTNIPTATWPSSTDPGVWRATAPTAKPSTTTGSRPRDPLRRDRARACGEVDSSAKQPSCPLPHRPNHHNKSGQLSLLSTPLRPSIQPRGASDRVPADGTRGTSCRLTAACRKHVRRHGNGDRN